MYGGWPPALMGAQIGVGASCWGQGWPGPGATVLLIFPPFWQLGSYYIGWAFPFLSRKIHLLHSQRLGCWHSGSKKEGTGVAGPCIQLANFYFIYLFTPTFTPSFHQVCIDSISSYNKHLGGRHNCLEFQVVIQPLHIYTFN